jgi:hypothetical protein
MSASISFSNVFSADPILSKMDDPNILWGDLLIELEPTLVSPSIPNLSNRKSIQNRYPVIVHLQRSESSDTFNAYTTSNTCKTLSIQWGMSKLAKWRTANPNPLDWKQYEVNIARALICGLQNSGWNVSAPPHPSFICSITRKDSDERATTSAPWVYEEPDCPTMLCLNDIKLFFPVIWHKLETNCKTYSLEMYHDKIRTTASSRGVLPEILTNHLSSLLMMTLAQSPAWNVMQSQMVGEQCRLVVV